MNDADVLIYGLIALIARLKRDLAGESGQLAGSSLAGFS